MLWIKSSKRPHYITLSVRTIKINRECEDEFNLIKARL